MHASTFDPVAQARALLRQGRLDDALALLRASAAAQPAAAVELAQALLYFVGDERAVAEAVARLQEAAAAGFAAAGYWLALIAVGDLALSRDPAQVAAWLDSSAAGGFAPARQALALLREGANERGMGTAGPQAWFEPGPLRRLHEQPGVWVADTLLGTSECRWIARTGAPALRPSEVHDPESGAELRLPLRSSHGMAFDLLQEDLVLRVLQLRMARAAGCELVQGEPLVLLRYRPSEQYRPHRDYLSPAALAASRPEAGQRQRTVCSYLNPVEAGGATAFPELELVVEPRAGAAVIFDNLDAEGRPEQASLHAGLPVERGEKWLATLWLRERAVRGY